MNVDAGVATAFAYLGDESGYVAAAALDDSWIYLSLVDENRNGVIARVKKP